MYTSYMYLLIVMVESYMYLLIVMVESAWHDQVKCKHEMLLCKCKTEISVCINNVCYEL